MRRTLLRTKIWLLKIVERLANVAGLIRSIEDRAFSVEVCACAKILKAKAELYALDH